MSRNKEKKLNPVDFWMKRTEKIPGLFQDLIGARTAPEFLAHLARDFEIQHRNNVAEEDCRTNIEHYLNEITELQKKLSRYFDRFLNAVGLGKETSRVNEIAADIRRAELSLQDLLLDILGDPDAVARQIRQGKLTFA